MAITIKEKELINKRFGSPQAAYDELIRFAKDADSLSKIRSKLTIEYPDKWVAFYNGELVAIADTLEEVLSDIRKAGLREHDVVTQFLNNKKMTMIL